MNINWFDRLGVQRKILISNFLMILLPVVFVSILVMGVWGVLRYTNPVEHRFWMMLAPSGLQEQMVQWSLGRLNKMQVKSTNPDVEDIRDASSVIEALGVDLMVVNNGEIKYITPGATVQDIIYNINYEHVDSDGAIQPLVTIDTTKNIGYNVDNIHLLLWDEDMLQFINNYDDGDFIIASGRVPFMAKTLGEESLEKIFVEGVFGAAIAVVIIAIIGFGIYVSNRVSAYILQPLQDLQGAARALREEGTFNIIPVRQMDELGQTVEAFNTMQRSLQAEAQQRQEYEASRRDMMAGICHDISTPLTSVKGFSSALIDGVANTEEKRQRYAQRIYDMSNKIENLVNMLSDFSKLEMGQVLYYMESVPIAAVLEEFVVQKRDDYKEQKLQLTSILESPDVLVSIDTNQFMRVLDNLVNNSWKYRDHDDLHICIESRIVNDAVQVIVEDDGPGVEAESLNHIFDIFYRTDKARNDVAMGSGIGLAIVKQIVEDFGGTIIAESAIGHKGLRMTMTLPIIK